MYSDLMITFYGNVHFLIINNLCISTVILFHKILTHRLVQSKQQREAR